MSIRDRVRSLTTVFGEWQIKEELGSGSNGKTAVFRIVRPNGKFVEEAALKIVNIIEESGSLNAMSASYQEEYNRRKQELQQKAIEEVLVMYQLQGNSTIVSYQDYRTRSFQDERGFGCDLFIRMELMQQDLRSFQKKGTVFSEAEILRIGQDICTALELCHGVNVWHRDIKPANIFRSRQGQYKLGDFGISRIVSAGQSAGTNVGTKPYAAPEQFLPEYDGRVDIYSLGLTLYELANRNRLPFSETTFVSDAAITRRLRGEPLPPPAGVSAGLGAVLLKACAFDPAARFQSASEFLAALRDTAGYAAKAAPETQILPGAASQPDPYGTQRAMPSAEEARVQTPSPQSDKTTTQTQEIHIHTGLSPSVVVTLIVCILVIVVVALGAAAYLFLGSQDGESSTDATTTQADGDGSAEISTLNDRGDTDPSLWGTEANADLYPVPTRTLVYDEDDPMEGGDVKYVQAALTELSYYGVEVNGIYDSGTEDAVERFQEKHGPSTSESGEVDSNTLAEIQTILAASREDDEETARVEELAKTSEVTEANLDLYSAPTRTLEYGMTGTDVRYVQSALVELSYADVSVNGVYDSGTEDAVTRYQTKHKCTITGKVDSATLSSMEDLVQYYRDQDAAEAEANKTSSATVTEANADLYPVPTRSLQYGSTGDDVRYVQAALVEMSYYGVEVNGVFDTGTEKAVKRFQQNHGRKVDGIVGEKTLASIQTRLAEVRADDEDASGTDSSSVSADDYPVPERTLSYSADDPMTGDDVKYVQAALIEMNYTDTPISLNGTYDSNTVAAVKRFQKNHNCTVDGVVGEKTLAALQSALTDWRKTH